MRRSLRAVEAAAAKAALTKKARLHGEAALGMIRKAHTVGTFMWTEAVQADFLGRLKHQARLAFRAAAFRLGEK